MNKEFGGADQARGHRGGVIPTVVLAAALLVSGCSNDKEVPDAFKRDAHSSETTDTPKSKFKEIELTQEQSQAMLDELVQWFHKQAAAKGYIGARQSDTITLDVEKPLDSRSQRTVVEITFGEFAPDQIDQISSDDIAGFSIQTNNLVVLKDGTPPTMPSPTNQNFIDPINYSINLYKLQFADIEDKHTSLPQTGANTQAFVFSTNHPDFVAQDLLDPAVPSVSDLEPVAFLQQTFALTD